MEEKTSLASEVASAAYDAADKPFDFLGANSETALICEMDQAVKEKIAKTLTDMGYNITEAVSGREALKSMRFHIYDLVVVNENFDVTDAGGTNDVMHYLQNLATAVRRNIFVALLSDNYRTMDNMTAFNKSVNLVVNKKNVDDFPVIIKRALDDNKVFYGVFKETLKKIGRI